MTSAPFAFVVPDVQRETNNFHDAIALSSESYPQRQVLHFHTCSTRCTTRRQIDLYT